MNTLNSLLADAVINHEQAMELIATVILYFYTSDLIVGLDSEEKYIRAYCDWVAEHEIERQISDPFTVFLSRAMKDEKNVFIISMHPARRRSATLMLKYSNVTFGFAFAFQVATLTNNERERSKVMSDFLEDKKALRETVNQLEGLEDAEMDILNRFDSNLERLLNNNGHAIELV